MRSRYLDEKEYFSNEKQNNDVFSPDKQPPPVAQLDHKSARQVSTSVQKEPRDFFKPIYHQINCIYFGENVRIKSLSLSGRDPAYIPVWQKAMVI